MIMTRRFLAMACAALCGLGLNASVAQADIYTWTDANGRVNISNVTPPEGVRVTSVVREAPKPVVPMALAITSAPQQDVQALNDRLRQLELEVELAKRQPPPPTVIYAAAPAAQPPVQYNYAPEPAPSYGYGYGYGNGCDPSWFGCGFGYSPYWYYPGGVVVIKTPQFHRRGFDHGRFPVVNPLPGRGGGPGQGRPPRPGARSPGGMRMAASVGHR